MRWPHDSSADFGSGMSSEPQVKHSTNFVDDGTEVVECLRDGAGGANGIDSRLLDRLDEGAGCELSSCVSATLGSFVEVVLLLFIDGRVCALREWRACPSSSRRSATCEMLSSGVTSVSITVGRLRRLDGADRLDDFLSDRSPCPSFLLLLLVASTSTVTDSSCASTAGVGPYT